MKRCIHLTGVLAEAGVLLFLLVLAIGAQPKAYANSNIIRVPDAYPTIQAAIDAADKGGEIRVATGDHAENLSFAKDITLTRGWGAEFKTRNPWKGRWLYLPVVFRSAVPRVGWAIGWDENYAAAIAHTADGGLTWQAQGDLSAWTGVQGTDISAVDDQTAWAALGSGGPGDASAAILHTTDGGATWVTQTIPAGLSGGMKSVKGLSRGEAWAASLTGTILHTIDGGNTWNVVPHPTAPITQVNRMDAMGANVWIADASAGGAVIHSSDAGQTWQATYLPGDSPLTVHAFSPQVIWASGSDTTVNPSFYRTVDGGLSWVRISQLGGLDHLDDVCAASPNDAWGVQNGNGHTGPIWLAHVAAGGITDAVKFSLPELIGYTPGGVTCTDASVAWVVAQKGLSTAPDKPLGIILHTVDGENWVQQSAPTNIHYWKVSFAGARR